jgi:hypothetical protein
LMILPCSFAKMSLKFFLGWVSVGLGQVKIGDHGEKKNE